MLGLIHSHVCGCGLFWAFERYFLPLCHYSIYSHLFFFPFLCFFFFSPLTPLPFSFYFSFLFSFSLFLLLYLLWRLFPFPFISLFFFPFLCFFFLSPSLFSRRVHPRLSERERIWERELIRDSVRETQKLEEEEEEKSMGFRRWVFSRD